MWRLLHVAVLLTGLCVSAQAQQPKAAIVPAPTADYGIVPSVTVAAGGVVLKATPGNLYNIYAYCTAACWLMVFNSATVPVDGGTTIGTASGNLQECVPILAGGIGSINYNPGPGSFFTVGISAVVSSTTCATKTQVAPLFLHGSVR